MAPSRPALVLLVVLATATSGCTTLGTTSESNPAPVALDEETWDPFEPFNRAMFSFNEKFDQWLLKPVAKGYDWVTPGLVQQGVGNFFSNLIQPRIALNDLLQGKFTQSARDVGRFLVNSTAGVLGLVDVAKLIGLEPKEEDWGQTFAVWGVGDGPYFVWPIIGPRYARDTVGFGFDYLSNPITYVEPPAASWGLWGADIVDTRARFLPAEKVLEQAMGQDKYIFIREAYRQRRRNLIYDGNPPKSVFVDDEAESVASKSEAEPTTTETPEPMQTGTSASAPPVQKYEPEFKMSDTEANRVAVDSVYTKISDAKKALKDKILTKGEYKKVVARLDSAMKNEFDQAKRDLKAGKLNKQEYKNSIEATEKKYE